MSDVRLNLALAALKTIAGCGLDAAGCVRTAAIALAAIEGLEAGLRSEFDEMAGATNPRWLGQWGGREFSKAAGEPVQADLSKEATS